MLISDDDKQRYLNFALDLAKDLRSLSIPADTILWHYTTGFSLISIFETMTLYSTQLSCLNDSTELRYASKHFQNALATKRTAITLAGLPAELLDGAIEYFREKPDFSFQAIVPKFVTCFSQERDDLSQWRAYGDGENGYAIGFKARYLFGIPEAVLVRVNYDAALHSKLAIRTVDAMVDFFVEGVEKYAPGNLKVFGEEFLDNWDAVIVAVAALVKDPAFTKEEECRIIKEFRPHELQELKFVQKGTMMSRHLPLRPPAGNAFNPYRLPIAEVMIGPCRHPHTSKTTVDTLLKQKGYPTGLVSISKIRYQST